jgi:hypothetical protein
MEFLHRQQILPLDYNLTFEKYHTYDEHLEVGRERVKEAALRLEDEAREQVSESEEMGGCMVVWVGG